MHESNQALLGSSLDQAMLFNFAILQLANEAGGRECSGGTTANIPMCDHNKMKIYSIQISVL